MRVSSGQGRPRSAREHHEPLRPASTELEEVLVVRQAARLQLIYERTECIDIVNGAECDKIALDAKFGIGEAEPRIERSARKPHLLVRLASKEERRNTVSDWQWH